MNKTFRRERQQIQILEHHCANYDEFFFTGDSHHEWDFVGGSATARETVGDNLTLVLIARVRQINSIVL